MINRFVTFIAFAAIALNVEAGGSIERGFLLERTEAELTSPRGGEARVSANHVNYLLIDKTMLVYLSDFMGVEKEEYLCFEELGDSLLAWKLLWQDNDMDSISAPMEIGVGRSISVGKARYEIKAELSDIELEPLKKRANVYSYGNIEKQCNDFFSFKERLNAEPALYKTMRKISHERAAIGDANYPWGEVSDAFNNLDDQEWIQWYNFRQKQLRPVDTSTLFHFSVNTKAVIRVRHLVGQGLKIGPTEVMLTVNEKNIELLTEIIAHIDSIDAFDSSLLRNALFEKWVDGVKYLFSQGAKMPSAETIASSIAPRDCIECVPLVEKGIEVNLVYKYAIKYKALKLISWSLSNGARLSDQTVFVNSRAALMKDADLYQKILNSLTFDADKAEAKPPICTDAPVGLGIKFCRDQ